MGLAEPKRKVRYSTDPNVLNWSNDDSKIGSKLMAKMGWAKGKGLGAREDGMTEHIKVKYKSDNKGIGYNPNEYDNVWIDHQDEFENILSSLSSGKEKKQQDEKPTTSGVQFLEVKSKQSRARLHYTKFAKSKDLSSVSENDLSCILGNKSTTAKRKLTEVVEVVENENSSSDCEEIRIGFGFNSSNQAKKVAETAQAKTLTIEKGLQFTTNSLSIGDYFAQKMAAKKQAIVAMPHHESIRGEQAENGETLKQAEVVNAKNDQVIDEDVVEEAVKKVKREKPPKDRELRKLMKKSFKGSNFFQINGYSSYVISMSIEEALKEKQKLINKKQNILEKNLEKDPNFYNMNKKINC